MLKRIIPVCLILVACGEGEGTQNDSTQETQTIEVINEEPLAVSVDGIKETVLTDLDEDGSLDTIRMSNPKMAEPGDYDMLDVIFSNGEVAHFENPGLWDLKPAELNVSTEDLVASDRVTVVNSKGAKFLIAFGYSYGCCPRLCSVIELNGPDSKRIYNEEFEVIEIGNIYGDDAIEIVGRTAFPEKTEKDEEKGYEIGDYCPYFVYDLATMTINEEAMEIYNQEQYVYLGPEVNTKMKLAYPLDGSKPYYLDMD